jgi:hypothetical protein
MAALVADHVVSTHAIRGAAFNPRDRVRDRHDASVTEHFLFVSTRATATTSATLVTRGYLDQYRRFNPALRSASSTPRSSHFNPRDRSQRIALRRHTSQTARNSRFNPRDRRQRSRHKPIEQLVPREPPFQPTRSQQIAIATVAVATGSEGRPVVSTLATAASDRDRPRLAYRVGTTARFNPRDREPRTAIGKRSTATIHQCGHGRTLSPVSTRAAIPRSRRPNRLPGSTHGRVSIRATVHSDRDEVVRVLGSAWQVSTRATVIATYTGHCARGVLTAVSTPAITNSDRDRRCSGC